MDDRVDLPKPRTPVIGHTRTETRMLIKRRTAQHSPSFPSQPSVAKSSHSSHLILFHFIRPWNLLFHPFSVVESPIPSHFGRGISYSIPFQPWNLLFHPISYSILFQPWNLYKNNKASTVVNHMYCSSVASPDQPPQQSQAPGPARIPTAIPTLARKSIGAWNLYGRYKGQEPQIER